MEQDEKEKNLRRILNFGHTIGHALEATTGYQHFRHGEAVAWGMKAAGYISYLEGYITQDDSERINHIISYLNLPSIPVNVNIHALLDAMLHDKKQTITGLKWILLQKIGYCFVADKLEQKKVENAVRWLLNQSSRP